jgi:hypothetical protein
MTTWLSVKARMTSSGETPSGSSSPRSPKNVDAETSASVPLGNDLVDSGAKAPLAQAPVVQPMLVIGSLASATPRRVACAGGRYLTG